MRKIVEKTKFLPREQKIVSVYPSKPIGINVLVFGRNEKLLKLGFLAEKQDVSGSKGQLF